MSTGSVSTCAESFHVLPVRTQVARTTFECSIETQAFAQIVSAFAWRVIVTVVAKYTGWREQLIQNVPWGFAPAFSQVGDLLPLRWREFNLTGIDRHGSSLTLVDRRRALDQFNEVVV